MSGYNVKVGDLYIIGSTQSMGQPPGDPKRAYVMIAVVAPKPGHYRDLETAKVCAKAIRNLLKTSAKNVRIVPGRNPR